MITDIANEQVKEHDVSIIVINNMEDKNVINDVDKRVRIIRCNRSWGSKNPWHLIKLNLLLYREKPDVIHCHASTMSKWILYTGGKPKYVTIHNARPLSFYGRFDKIFAISKAVSEVILRNSGQKSVVVYNGVHPEKIKVREKAYSPGDFLRIVCVGRVFEYKGQQLLIEAAKKLIDDGYRQFSITIVGDGDNLGNVKSLSEKYKLEDHVIFTGFKSREWVFSHLCDYDLFVQPSITEGFGLTLAEAMAAKITVMTSNLEGPMEVIEDGKYGISFQSEDIDDLTSKIEGFIKGHIHVDVVKAREFVINNFDVKVTSQRYIDEYLKK